MKAKTSLAEAKEMGRVMFVQFPKKPALETIASAIGGYNVNTIDRWRQEDMWDIQRERYRLDQLRSMFRKKGLLIEQLQAQAVEVYRDILTCAGKIAKEEQKERRPDVPRLEAATKLADACHKLIRDVHPDTL